MKKLTPDQIQAVIGLCEEALQTLDELGERACRDLHYKLADSDVLSDADARDVLNSLEGDDLKVLFSHVAVGMAVYGLYRQGATDWTRPRSKGPIT